MKNAFALAMLAGTVVSSTAFGQELPPLPVMGEVRIDPVGFPAAGGYESRSIQPVYDCLSATFGNGSSTHLGTNSQILEDISFQNGPWATATTKLMTEITYGLGVITTPTTAADAVYFVFWPKSAVNFQGFGGANTNMINPAATPIAVLDINAAGLGSGSYWQVTTSLAGFAGGGITIPAADDGFFLQVVWVTLADPTGTVRYAPTTSWSVIDTNATGGIAAGCASTTDRALVFGSQSGAALPGNPASPGFTSVSYGRDISNATMCPNIGFMVGNGGAAAGAGNVEHRFINASPARGYMVRFRGDVAAPLPTPVTALGCVADGASTRASTVAASGVKWYSLCLSGDATDNALQFLDIDTEGSAGDVAIGLFDSSGALIANDDASGNGTNDQLTFGVGIRASGGGDGLQYNGRSGELIASSVDNPLYYVAVAPAGSAFGGGFTVTSAPAAGGAFNLNVNTNVNGSALAASVTPDVLSGNQVGDIVSPGAVAAASTTGLRGIVWYSFNVAFDTTCSDRFLDIDFNGNGHTATADTEAFIFNSSGNIVAIDDDSGPAALSQFSFNNIPGPADRPAIGDGLPHAGQDGNITPGTYYMAVGLFNVTDLGAGGRFHVRGTSGSNLSVAPVWNTDFDSSNGCNNVCAFTICAADYNIDGGVDGTDIAAFFPDWEASAPCADVDQDGGVTGGDIEFFFTLWEAGGC